MLGLRLDVKLPGLEAAPPAAAAAAAGVQLWEQLGRLPLVLGGWGVLQGPLCTRVLEVMNATENVDMISFPALRYPHIQGWTPTCLSPPCLDSTRVIYNHICSPKPIWPASFPELTCAQQAARSGQECLQESRRREFICPLVVKCWGLAGPRQQ